ncbi:hypothetical protein GCM10027408_00290 [Microbacterium tumbae]
MLSAPVQSIVVAIILINAAILGLETVPDIAHGLADVLHVIDTACLGIFVIEILLKLYAQRLRFFTNAWNVFDFLVVAASLVPGADGLAVLRALRVLRVLRLISVIPSLRRVVDALVKAVPGIASIAALLAIIFYVGAVMSTMLFGRDFPDMFGDLAASLFSLFQIMTLDGWSEMARTVAAELPWAWAFFVPFVLVSALTVLNLFIAIIVDAMQGLDASRVEEGEEPRHEVTLGHHEDAEVLAELALLSEQIAALAQAVEVNGRVVAQE